MAMAPQMFTSMSDATMAGHIDLARRRIVVIAPGTRILSVA